MGGCTSTNSKKYQELNGNTFHVSKTRVDEQYMDKVDGGTNKTETTKNNITPAPQQQQLEDKPPLVWTKMQSFPFKHFVEPLFINNDEFVVVPWKDNQFNSCEIYTFNIKRNRWNKIIEYDENNRGDAHSAAYDQTNQSLHVYTGCGYLLQFDLKKNKFVSEARHLIMKYGAKLIYVEQELHQIGSEKSNAHYILYHGGKEFKKIHEFKSFRKLFGHRLVHLQYNKSILLFGGITGLADYNDSVYEYSIITQKWTNINVKIPQSKLIHFGLVKTRNERFCVILGGYIEENGSTDTIYIFDTQNNVFIKSKISCPTQGLFHATIGNNSERDELLTFGFINNYYKSDNFPSPLIELISHWVCNQEIYLLQKGTGEHWKISIDSVLNNVSSFN